ncbi:MAG TPA: TolC family protein [Candidatus Methylacidiphilales bacterium]|nr:TolC family protein [Candidatus Methylacidiphilales bacterium]
MTAMALTLSCGGLLSLTADPAQDPEEEIPATTLTWTDCVRLATQYNPDLQSAREQVLNSDAVHMGAYSALYPQISLSYNESRSYASANLYASHSYATAYGEQVSLSQLIFDGFATKGNIDQAKAQLDLAFAELDGEKATVSFNLKSSFAQLLYAEKLIKISEDIVDIRKSAARLVRLLYEGGSEDKGDMELAEANLAQSLYSLDQSVRTRDLSAVQLSVFIGKDLPAPVLAEGELVTDHLPVMPDFQKLARVTPLYNERQAEVGASAAGLTVAKSGWWPRITANADATHTDDAFPLRNHGFGAGFAVTYPLFQGGATYFNVKAADASLRQALDNLRSGTNDAALTLAQMFKGMVDSEDNVRIQQELLEATALRYKISSADYRNGLMSFEDFNNITDDYVSQQLSLLSAQLSAVVAEAGWEEAKGVGALP